MSANGSGIECHTWVITDATRLGDLPDGGS